MRTAQIGPYLRLVKILLIFLEYILQFVINAATGRISWGKSLEIILIYGTVVKGIILNAVGSGFDSRSRNFYFLFLVVLVLSVWLFCVGRRRVGHGKVYIFCNFSVSQWFFFFFFNNLLFLQLSVSILGELGTLKKSIRTMANETLRVMFGVMLGKENDTFCHILYYETFWWAVPT